MKVTQYTTDKYGEYRSISLSPSSGRLNGIKNLVVDDSVSLSDCEGLGVAITDSSCYLLSTMDKSKRREFLSNMYGKDGLAMNVARISIGSSDYSKDIYTYDDYENDLELEHFSITRDEEYKIPIIKEIKEINPNIFMIASPWSPPGWMKTGGSICGGYMIDKYAQIYAKYLYKFITAYKSHGINIDAITIQNEPNGDQEGRMPACIYHPETEVKTALELGKLLEKNNIKTRILLLDHCYDAWHRVKWQYDSYPKLLDVAGEVAFHYYNNSFKMAQNLFATYPNVKWHMTEGGPRLFERYNDDWSKWGTTIMKALYQGAKSFTGWNLLLDETGGPNVGPFFCGGFATLNSSTKELTYSGQYKAYTHFSKYVSKSTKIHPARVMEDGPCMTWFYKPWFPIEAVGIDTEDGTHVVSVVNPSSEFKCQLQYCYRDKWYYIELLPDSLATVVFSE